MCVFNIQKYALMCMRLAAECRGLAADAPEPDLKGDLPSYGQHMDGIGGSAPCPALTHDLRGNREKVAGGLVWLNSSSIRHASDFMHRHRGFDRCQESYPRRNELHQNYYSRDGDEQSAAPAGV